jgi:hypothetical protein
MGFRQTQKLQVVKSTEWSGISIGADLGKILGAQLSLPLFNGDPGYNPWKIFEITDDRR